MDWLMKWIDWIARDPGNAAWWMGWATIALMLLVVTVSRIRWHRKVQQRERERRAEAAFRAESDKELSDE